MDIIPCARCKRKVNLRMDRENLCYECLSKIRVNNQRKDELFLKQFDKFIVLYADMRVQCMCGKQSTMKASHEEKWKKLHNGPFFCDSCQKGLGGVNFESHTN